ncbi:hypothetical protein MKO06_11375 [Gramella sp. GC03-9]|uniref:Uncharacterized protein n=1 Tax=Christiangramia oceanisediminis TaxID=2920386 RepID=A0A9X2RAF5_9FLAO|nr:hypothetical protein [Gramella oceanisediminis]MCP9200514.1 hypothetical protein [Gramella oceanisediminis]
MQVRKEQIVTTREDFSQIETVRKMIEEVHESGNFFNLSLNTLELIRRFNQLYTRIHEDREESPAVINQLIVCSLNLEKHLVHEN